MAVRLSQNKGHQKPMDALSVIFDIIKCEKKKYGKLSQKASGPLDVVEINYQKIIAEKQRALAKNVETFTRKLDKLIRQVTLQEISPQAEFISVNWFINKAWPLPPNVPSQDEIFSIMKDIVLAYTDDYGPEFDVDIYFQTLIHRVKNLAKALGVSLELKILNSALSEAPLDKLQMREQEFWALDKVYQQESTKYFYSDFGKLDHPFNRRKWDKVRAAIQRDIQALKPISTEFTRLNDKIKTAKIEADLPCVEEVAALDALISKSLPSESRRFFYVKNKCEELRAQIELIKTKKVDQARKDFSAYDKIFTAWQQQIDTIRNELTFPWPELPPSLRKVDAKIREITKHRKEYNDWPCTFAVISKKEYVLEEHYELLDEMTNQSLEIINDAFSDPGYNVETLQAHIKLYKQLLRKQDSVQADRSIIKMELALFRFAHNQARKSQWFQFFRYSFYDNLATDSISWRDVAANLHGGNCGYSGARTVEVLETLGWYQNGQWSSFAPKELLENEKSYHIGMGRM